MNKNPIYTLRVTNRYKKHLKLLAKRNIEHVKKVHNVVHLLLCGTPLPKNLCDHALTGNYKDFRECHVLPDLLLIYKIEKDILILNLVDVGSHSDLFK